MRIHYFLFLPCLPQPSPHWTQGRTSLASLKLTCLRFMVNTEEKVDIDNCCSEQLTHLHRPERRVFCAKSRWIQHNDSAHLMVVNLDFSFTKRFPASLLTMCTHKLWVTVCSCVITMCAYNMFLCALLTMDQKFWRVPDNGHSVTITSFAWCWGYFDIAFDCLLFSQSYFVIL